MSINLKATLISIVWSISAQIYSDIALLRTVQTIKKMNVK